MPEFIINPSECDLQICSHPRPSTIRARKSIEVVWQIPPDSLAESRDAEVTVELPTISIIVNEAVTVTEWVPETFATTWNSPLQVHRVSSD